MAPQKLEDGKQQLYDLDADIFEHRVVPRVFMAPARDLIASLAIPDGGHVLDVGSGTGAAARLTMDTVGKNGIVVALDPSPEMLRVAQEKGVTRVVVGEVPGLPFSDNTFDRVMANFVISHIHDYQAALFDMQRVIKKGGQLGITTWRVSSNKYMEIWREVAAAFIDGDLLAKEYQKIIPHEEVFADSANIQEVLGQSGFANLKVEEHDYHIRMSIAEYLSCQEVLLGAKLMREMLSREKWESFRVSLREMFQERFRDPVEYTQEAYIAIGHKP